MLQGLAQQVVAGEVIAVEHSDLEHSQDYDYFLLRASKPGYTLRSQTTDDFGALFTPGDVVVEVLCSVGGWLICMFRESSLSTPVPMRRTSTGNHYG